MGVVAIADSLESRLRHVETEDAKVEILRKGLAVESRSARVEITPGNLEVQTVDRCFSEPLSVMPDAESALRSFNDGALKIEFTRFYGFELRRMVGSQSAVMFSPEYDGEREIGRRELVYILGVQDRESLRRTFKRRRIFFPVGLPVKVDPLLCYVFSRDTSNYPSKFKVGVANRAGVPYKEAYVIFEQLGMKEKLAGFDFTAEQIDMIRVRLDEPLSEIGKSFEPNKIIPPFKLAPLLGMGRSGLSRLKERHPQFLQPNGLSMSAEAAVCYIISRFHYRGEKRIAVHSKFPPERKLGLLEHFGINEKSLPDAIRNNFLLESLKNYMKEEEVRAIAKHYGLHLMEYEESRRLPYVEAARSLGLSNEELENLLSSDRYDFQRSLRKIPMKSLACAILAAKLADKEKVRLFRLEGMHGESPDDIANTYKLYEMLRQCEKHDSRLHIMSGEISDLFDGTMIFSGGVLKDLPRYCSGRCYHIFDIANLHYRGARFQLAQQQLCASVKNRFNGGPIILDAEFDYTLAEASSITGVFMEDLRKKFSTFHVLGKELLKYLLQQRRFDALKYVGFTGAEEEVKGKVEAMLGESIS